MGFIDNVANTIKGYDDALFGWFDRLIQEAVRDLTGVESGRLVDATLPPLPDLWADLRDNPRTPRSVRTLLQQYDAYPWPFKASIGIVWSATAIVSLVTAQHSAAATRMQQETNAAQRPQVLGVPDTIDLFRRRLLSEAQARDNLSRAGLTDADQSLLLAASSNQLAPMDVRDLILRGIVSPEQGRDALSRLGYTPADIDSMVALYQLIPTVSDLIPMAVKDVFDPAARERGNLDAEFPPAVVEWARKQGLSEFWARNYWAAHWQLPSPTMGYTMLHRGLVTPDQLDDLIRAQDYAPIWRENLRKISFLVPTRVDSRRMFEIDVINRSELKRLLQDGGYDEVNAERLTRFYERTTVEGDISKKKKSRDLSLGMLQEAYADGVIDSESFEADLLSLNYDHDEVAVMVAVQRYKRDRAWLKQYEDSIKAGYVKGFYDGDNVAQMLRAIGYDDDHITRLLLVWINLRDVRELTEAEAAERDLTKGDILQAFKDRSLTQGQASEMLQQLHYDRNEAAIMLANATTAQHKADLKDQTDLLQLLYVNNQLTRAQLVGRLDGLNLPARQRDALMERWEVERRRQLTKLTTAQISSFFERRFLTLTEMQTELRALGYSEVNVKRFSDLFSDGYRLDREGRVMDG